MEISREKLKNEIQGDGFLADIKERHLPDSEEMSELALEEYENRHGEVTSGNIKRQFSYILEQLLEIEKELYTRYEKDVYRNAIVHFLEDYYRENESPVNEFASRNTYPETHRLIREIEEVYNGDGEFIEDFREIIPRLYPLIDDISVSASQARRKRAGISLNNHVVNLLGTLPYEIADETQLGNCTSYEITRAEDGETAVFIMGYHTTLSDRYRQTLSEGPSGESQDIPKYLATAAGRGIITDDDRTDITANKVDDIHDHGFILLTFNDIKSEFRDHDGILSYEAFASRELPSIFR